jgi:hypothetical protein
VVFRIMYEARGKDEYLAMMTRMRVEILHVVVLGGEDRTA